MEGEREAMVLLLEDLMRCALGVAPGRKLTTTGKYVTKHDYARVSSPTSLLDMTRPQQSRAREMPFLEPLNNSRYAVGLV